MAAAAADVAVVRTGGADPTGAFFLTNYLAISQWRPAYSEFGGPWYEYAGSHWSRPGRGIDWAGLRESRAEYIMHCLIGHHGIFSLSPIWILAFAGMVLVLVRRLGGDDDQRWIRRWLAGGTLLVSLVVLGFYLTNKTVNYGGWTTGLRWLMWLSLLWLLTMVPVVDRREQEPLGSGLRVCAIGGVGDVGELCGVESVATSVAVYVPGSVGVGELLTEPLHARQLPKNCSLHAGPFLAYPRPLKRKTQMRPAPSRGTAVASRLSREAVMRHRAPWALSLALLAGLGAVAAAQDTPSSPAKQNSGNWFGNWSPFGQPAPKKTPPPPPKTLVESTTLLRDREKAALFRRQEVCLKLLEIAEANKDAALKRRVEQLQDQVMATYMQRIALLPVDSANPGDSQALANHLSPSDSASRLTDGVTARPAGNAVSQNTAREDGQ